METEEHRIQEAQAWLEAHHDKMRGFIELLAQVTAAGDVTRLSWLMALVQRMFNASLDIMRTSQDQRLS